jgi:tRNA threonylcarbamoyladenosine biosynthesis protein TsaB
MLLAVDTATCMASLALYDQVNGLTLGEEVWRSVNNHTVELMPRLVRMMDQQGVSPASLDGVAVSLGPGSFTGLRIGLGVAKGLALARKLPLVGVPTLEVVARPHMGRRICAVQYARRRGRWRQTGPYELTTLDRLCDRIEQAALVCGEIGAQGARMVLERLGDTVTVATPAASARRAAYLAELGWERLSRGDADELAALSPIYLHHPQIDA